LKALSAESAVSTELPAVVCLAEDRPSEEVAVRLCIASLRRSNPDTPVIAYLPNASEPLRGWVAKQTLVEIRQRVPGGGRGWNVKADALLSVLEEGVFTQVWWVDSDVIVRRPLSATYGAVPKEIFMATEEALSAAYLDGGARARAWGFTPARNFNFTLNSGVLRASMEHIGLLKRWKTLLESAQYRDAQALGWRNCPAHLLGDQDVLTALLCASEFAEIPVRVLRRGPDIIQYYGLACYTLRERLGNAFNGGPTFVHSQGFKPWRPAEPESISAVRRMYRNLLSDSSAYLIEARQLRVQIDDELLWTRARNPVGRGLQLLGCGHRVTTGLPLALVGDAVRVMRWMSSRIRREK
jgi:hypothetical protein